MKRSLSLLKGTRSLSLSKGRVLGVDGCPDGWVAVAPDLDRPRVYAEASLQAVISTASADGPLACVGVDIPIGLADHGWRQADLEAKALLGRRGASLFMTPVRGALELTDYAAAVEVNREQTGQGFSRQAYGLRTKILEVDAFVRDYAGILIEVHPELSFATMAGTTLGHGKKTWAGAAERQQLLARNGITLTAELGSDPGRAGVDDVLDAAAAAWTARRHLDGRAESVPVQPSPGVPGVIWR